jgi:hypothetical protein
MQPLCKNRCRGDDLPRIVIRGWSSRGQIHEFPGRRPGAPRSEMPSLWWLYAMNRHGPLFDHLVSATEQRR